MNFIKHIQSIFGSNINLNISENIKKFSLEFELKGNILTLSIIKNFLSIFDSIDDAYNITLTNDADTIINLSNTNSYTDINLFLESSSGQEDIVSFNIIITKEIKNNTLKYYNFDEFKKTFFNDMSKNIIKFNNLFKDRPNFIIEIFDQDIFIQTETLIIKKHNLDTDITKLINRSDKLKLSKDITTIISQNEFNLIPNDFNIIESRNIGEELINKFSLLNTILSIFYLSDKTIIQDNTLKLQLSEIVLKYDINTDIIENKVFFEIYNWISSDNNTIDKPTIAKNVIYNYCISNDFLSMNNMILSAIKSNFKMFQRENINNYLMLKDDMAKNIISMVENLSNTLLSFNKSFKQNIIAIFTFILTVFLTQVVNTSKSLENIFTLEIIIIFGFIIFGSAIFMFSSHKEVKDNISDYKDAYNDLKNNYKNVINEQELNQLFDDENNKFYNRIVKLEERVNKTFGYWKKTLFLSVLIIIGLMIFNWYK